MHSGDTSLGGSRRDFPSTTMGLLGRLADLTEENRVAALETLCRRYWKPVYQFVRLQWRKSNEEAKDLAQAFFAWILESDALRKYAPDRGSFRTYLKVLLKSFVGHEEEALGRLKRGGGHRLLPLDAEESPVRDLTPDARSADPEKAFDQAWLDELVREAVERVRLRFEASGRGVQFKVFEAYDLSAPGDEKVSYTNVARHFGLKEGDVRNHLFAVREAVRAEIRVGLAGTTSDERALEDEWNELFGG